ncbi:translation termination inhibitor protein itt1 [Ceratobasidium sp. 392]|nr:translation termination inhibitor protein itt1 [Ceratobasidium sp. 392]
MASSARDEIDVLLSVYPDILTTTDVPAGLEIKLDIAIEFERERVFELVSSITSDPSSTSSENSIQVRLSHLPSLLLTVLLPPEYPSTADPIVRSIHARHAWLAPGLCLRSFWGLSVKEGEVGKVACPGVECTQEREKRKEEDMVGGAEWEDCVRRVLSEEEVTRWKWLRIKQAAEKDPNTVPCPVRTCQAPVVRPKAAADDESGWARLRTCDACGFAFCVGCRRTWHGPVTRCAVTRTVEFMEAYIALDEGDSRRRALEAQYGKKNMERMAAEYMQQKENENWLKERTMACPGCRTNVEKSQGCNHMTCARCAVHFCYRCGTKLAAHSPYKHFEQPGSCYGRLFDYDPSTWEPDEGDLLRLALE